MSASRGVAVLLACLAVCSWPSADLTAQSLVRHEATRMSMACLYAIEAYGPDAEKLARVVEEAFDEVDRIDRLMSHYRADSTVSRVNREAAQRPVAVGAELYDLIAAAVHYNRESSGAFDITVGPLMKAWGFFRDEGRVPSAEALAAARRLVGGGYLALDPVTRTVAFNRSGVEIDLGGIAKGYAVDRAAALLRERQIASALISAGGSSIYALGTPPGRPAWDVTIADPVDHRNAALTVQLKDRALSVAGRSEKSFESSGVTYAHIMDPRSGRPVQGVLTVAVLASTATAGDALDNAFFVLGPEGSREYLRRLTGIEALFFMPAAQRAWTVVHRHGGTTS